MSKQSFTTGQVLTAAQMTSLQANDYNQTVSAKVASYVLVATDAGTRITMSNASATTITVNTALFTAGDTLTVTNIGAGVCTITAGTATVSTAGSLALQQYDSGTLYFTSTGVSIWNGANPGDITGVTAGTGISGGGTSGTVTITNSMATEITAAGDIVVGTGSGTFDNLPIGTTAQVLTADTTVSPYKVKWATPGGGMTLLNSGGTTLSGASTSISFTSTGYTGLTIVLKGVYVSTDAVAYFTLNNDGASNYSFAIVRGAGSVTRESNPAFGAYYYLFQTLPITNATLLTGNGQIDLFFPTDTDNVSFVVNTLGGSTGNLTVSNGMGTYDSSAVISRIDFFIAAGTFSGGKAYVYGVK